MPSIAAAYGPGSHASINNKSIQVPFITNNGQIDSEVAFYTNTSYGAVYVTRDSGIVYALKGEPGLVIKENFIKSRNSAVEGGIPADTLVNCYSGSDPSRWREAVQTFGSVKLGRKYDFIDIHLAAVKGTVEKIFTVHPGGDAANIRGRILSARSLQISETGHLLALFPGGKIEFSPPAAYQIKNGKRYNVDVSYDLYGNDYGFEVGKYDGTLPLIIDPLLASTYMGGKSNETAFALETYKGDIILAGTTDSTNFPGLESKVDALGDAFVLRLDPDLSTVRAITYFGGSMTEGVRAIAVGDSSIYAAGYNNSPNFPTTPGAAYSGTSLSGAFVVGMDPATLRITSSTSFYANVFGMAWSQAAGDVYVAGSTGDTGIPIAVGDYPAFQKTHNGGADSFVAALSEDLTTLKGATLLGGEGFDIIYDLAVDERGYPVAVGVTNSAAFPASENAFGPAYNLDWDASHQWIDGFVARFSPDLSSLESATYLGGGLIDNITAVAAKGSLILVGGNTASADFPCGSTFGPVDGNDAFVVLFNENLSRIRSCTVFGGSRPGTDSPESVSDVAFHPSGSIYAVGKTNASDFPTTPGAFFSHPPGSYFGSFIISFDRDLSAVEASTLVHGSSESLKAVVFDSWGDVIVAGDTSGSGYPVTAGVLQTEYAGGDDLVISRFTSDLTGPHIEPLPNELDFGHLPVALEGREELVLHNTGGSELTIKDVYFTTDSSPVFEFENPCINVPAFGSCTMEVYFKPFSTGNSRGELVILSNDHFHGEVKVDLKGKAIPASAIIRDENLMENRERRSFPRIEADPSPCIFGEVRKGENLSRTIRITNTGSVDLSLNQVVIEPPGKGPFAIREDSCSGAVLESMQVSADKLSYCEISVVFTPSMTGDVKARVRLSSKGLLSTESTVLIEGTGTDPEKQRYPGFWGWMAILVLILRMVLRIPVSASGWRRWIGKYSGK